MDLSIHWFGGPFGLRHDHKRAVSGTADRDRHEAAEATEADIFETPYSAELAENGADGIRSGAAAEIHCVA